MGTNYGTSEVVYVTIFMQTNWLAKKKCVLLVDWLQIWMAASLLDGKGKK